MPVYDINCPKCGEREDLLVSSVRYAVRGGIPCPDCDTVCSMSYHRQQSAKVLAQGQSFRVDGLRGEFTSYRDVDKAAAKLGRRVLEGDEKAAAVEAAREGSASYAKELGYGSRQEYGEARKTRGPAMEADAQAKRAEQASKRTPRAPDAPGLHQSV